LDPPIASRIAASAPAAPGCPPLRDLEIEVLPPVDANERPKGMAEVVMNPVAAALMNAIFDATGHRFRALPVTQEMIKGVLT
jgi:CO/xanthine dehydrogenase Mo-binding subunit